MEFICMGVMAGTENFNAPLLEIDNAPTIHPEPHWIPITEDLPKESGHYIVTTRTVCLPIYVLHPELNRYSNNVRIDYFCVDENKFDLPSTVAWWSEPLPEPYKEVTE